MSVRIPLIEVSGDARERGRQHGEAARDRIRASTDFYSESFAAVSGLTWDDVTNGQRVPKRHRAERLARTTCAVARKRAATVIAGLSALR